MGEIKVTATRDISKGEEVTECYTRGLMTKSEMKSKLQSDFSFDCKCDVCSGSIPDQDKISSQIQQEVPSLTKYHAHVLDIIETVSLIYFKEKNWMPEASKLERAANLAKQ